MLVSLALCLGRNIGTICLKICFNIWYDVFFLVRFCSLVCHFLRFSVDLCYVLRFMFICKLLMFITFVTCCCILCNADRENDLSVNERSGERLWSVASWRADDIWLSTRTVCGLVLLTVCFRLRNNWHLSCCWFGLAAGSTSIISITLNTGWNSN